MSPKAITVAITMKGISIAVVLKTVADVTFLQGLATAVCSAVISGTFLLVSINMTTKKTDTKITEVKEKIEAEPTPVGSGNGTE